MSRIGESGQLDQRPVLVEGGHQLDEVHERDGLEQVARDVEIVGFDFIALVVRRGQDDDRCVLEVRVLAQLAQQLDAAHPRHVEIEQDDAALRRHGAGAEHPERLDAVGGDEERVGDAVALERAAHVHHVDLVVFDEEDVESLVLHYASAGACGHVNANVAPAPGSERTDTVPPCASTIFLTSESPIPAPSTLSRVSNVWKMPQMRSWNSSGMPGPLSLTRNSQAPLRSLASTRMRTSRPPCLSALPIRFWKICWSGRRSVTSTGRSGAMETTPGAGESRSTTSLTIVATDRRA